MSRGHLTISLAVVLFTLLAGCTGGIDQVPGLTDGTNSPGQGDSQCADDQIPADAELEDLAPEAPSGWERVEVLVTTTEVIEGDSTGDEQELLAGNYTDPDGFTHILLIVELSEESKEAAMSSNGSIFGPQAVSGDYYVAAWGNSSSSHGTTLLTSVRCISEDDVTPRQELTIDYTPPSFNQSVANFSLDPGNYTVETNINYTTDASASFSNVEHGLRTDVGGNYLNVTVEGEFENTSLSVNVGGNTVLIPEEDLVDGEASVDVRLFQVPTESPMMLTITPTDFGVNTTYTEEIVFEGPELAIDDIEVETEANTFNDEYRVTRLQFDIHNTGDLGAQIGTITVTVNGEESDMFVMETVGAGSTLNIDSEEHAIFPPNMESGQNTLEIEVVVDGEVAATQSTTIELD